MVGHPLSPALQSEDRGQDQSCPHLEALRESCSESGSGVEGLPKARAVQGIKGFEGSH